MNNSLILFFSTPKVQKGAGQKKQVEWAHTDLAPKSIQNLNNLDSVTIWEKKKTYAYGMLPYAYGTCDLPVCVRELPYA